MNNFFGIFFLLPVFFGYQEQNYLYTFDPKYHVARDWIYLTLSCILGLALGWCGIKVRAPPSTAAARRDACESHFCSLACRRPTRRRPTVA